MTTKYCKNPNCKKQIPENLNYCNEDCLREHMNMKEEKKSKPIHLIEYSKETIDEVKEICDVFGFKHTDGMVTGSHNATILCNLRQWREGVYSTTVDKLTWMCHTSARNLKENYLKGIEAFGIIETSVNDFGVIKWRWVGIKALRNGNE